ncbi:MAG: tetratricopeptide repeat protein, partial [Bradymonadaceae bacterium]
TRREAAMTVTTSRHLLPAVVAATLTCLVPSAANSTETDPSETSVVVRAIQAEEHVVDEQFVAPGTNHLREAIEESERLELVRKRRLGPTRRRAPPTDGHSRRGARGQLVLETRVERMRRCLLSAKVVERDPERARRFYETGCSSPDEPDRTRDGASCYELAELYRAGTGVERNLHLAGRLYREACQSLGADDRPACAGLAQMYRHGEGGPVFFAEARELYVDECEDKLEHCGPGAEMLAGGLGGPRDVETARRFYKYACEDGSKAACEARSALMKGE